jgi:hypothetical protein
MGENPALPRSGHKATPTLIWVIKISLTNSWKILLEQIFSAYIYKYWDGKTLFISMNFKVFVFFRYVRTDWGCIFEQLTGLGAATVQIYSSYDATRCVFVYFLRFGALKLTLSHALSFSVLKTDVKSDSDCFITL